MILEIFIAINIEASEIEIFFFLTPEDKHNDENKNNKQHKLAWCLCIERGRKGTELRHLMCAEMSHYHCII